MSRAGCIRFRCVRCSRRRCGGFRMRLVKGKRRTFAEAIAKGRGVRNEIDDRRSNRMNYGPEPPDFPSRTTCFGHCPCPSCFLALLIEFLIDHQKRRRSVSLSASDHLFRSNIRFRRALSCRILTTFLNSSVGECTRPRLQIGEVF